MAAVSEVAQDPKAIAKHASNPKLQAFYRAMGSLVGSKLEAIGSKTGAAHGPSQPQQPRSATAARRASIECLP
jgi:hypothetical protein